MKDLLKNPLGLAALVLVLLAVLLPVVAYLGYRSNLGNLEQMLYSKGSALMEAVLHESENAILADREIVEELTEHLAAYARFALFLEKKGLLDDAELAELALTGALERLDVYSPSGRLISSSSPEKAPLETPREFTEAEFEYGLATAFIDEGEPSALDEDNGASELFSVAVLAEDSSVCVAYTAAGELTQLRRRLGIGMILDDLSAIEGVTYALLQDTLGIIAASSQVSSIGSIKGDEFFRIPAGEIRGRYTLFGGKEVYELAANFQLSGENYGFIRLGLDTEEIRSIAERDKKRFLLGVVVLTVLFSVGAGLYFAGRKQLRLEQEHSRIKGFSESVLQAMGESVIVLDEQDRVVLFNDSCKRLCGCQPRLVSGFHLRQVNPDLADVLKGIQRHQPTVIESEIQPHGRNVKIPVMISLAPLVVSGKHYTTVILSDLTDRKKAEKLALRNEKYRTLAQVSAGVAHEIRNPLNAIGMNVQRLKLEFSPEENKSAEYEAFIDTILAEVRRINEIVEQNLALARFPGPRMETAKLSEVLLETAAFFRPELEGRGIKLETSLAESPPSSFDPAQIRQVVTNLIKNAAESMEPGGRLEIIGEVADNHYRITFSDTGPGIAESDREKIFEPFFSTKSSGLGLGLALVKRIVTEHGGTIRVAENKGKGTTFIVSIPLKN